MYILPRVLTHVMLRFSVHAEGKTRRQHAFIVDGMSLKFALEEHHRETLREICYSVVTVLCCRMSPLQKAQVRRHSPLL